MKGIIPIGGRGTRMRPATFTINKHFIPVANKPLIYYPIESLVSAGVREIAITYNPGQLQSVRELLGNGSRWKAKFTYILQEKPIGLANIVQVCENWVGRDQFVFHLGDNIFTEGIQDLVDTFAKDKPDGLIAILHHPENTRMGVPYFNKKGELIKYKEKPIKPPHDYAIPGIYFGDKKFFKAFRGKDKIKPSKRGELEIPSPFQWLVNHGYTVKVKEYRGVWLDPGKFGDWLETNQYLLDKTIMSDNKSQSYESNKIEGRVQIGKNCTIEHSSIRGPAAIGDNVSIKNSFIGPYTSVYHSCQISDCHIQNSVLMRSVHLTSIKRPIDSSIIGPNCEISEKGESKNISLFIGEMGKISL